MGLEEAHEALEEKLSEPTELEPKSAEQELIDLDKVDKWRAQGKEWTREEWNKSYVPTSQYTKKSQEAAESRKSYEQTNKYVSNLAADLEAVKNDRNLVAEFLKVYPREFHSLLDRYLGATQQQQADMRQEVAPRTDLKLEKRLHELEERLSSQDTSMREAKVSAIDAQLDSLTTTMRDKYPLADEEIVIARAQVLHEKGAKLVNEDGRLNMETWDKIWKSVNDKSQELYKGHYSKQVSDQKQTSLKGKDVASGGGIPGQGPKKRSLKEATADAIAHFEGQRGQ